MTRLIAWITRQIPEWIALLRNVSWNTIGTKPRWLRHALMICVAVILLWCFWSANETIPTETSKTSGRQMNAATTSLFGEERLESDDILNLRHCFAKSKLNDYTLDSGRVLVPSDRVSAYLEALQQSKWKPTGSQERLEQALQRASSPMLTSDLRSKRLQLAEQERLGRQIETFDGIAEAIVSYEVENSGGFSRGKTARAAVMIRNQPDATLSVERAAAILDYVLCSVSGLKPENVVLIDRDTNRRFLGENLRRASLELDPRTLYRLAQEERLEKILASELASLGEPEIRITVTAIPQIAPRLPIADHVPAAANMPVTANVPVAENVPITSQTENIPAENTTHSNVRFHVGDTGHYVGYTPVEPLAIPTSEGTDSHFDAFERIPCSEFRESLANEEMATRMTNSKTIGTLDVTDLATGFAAVTAPLTSVPNPSLETNGSIQSSSSSRPSFPSGEADSVPSMDTLGANASTRTPTSPFLMESDHSVESSSATSLQANRPVALPEGLTSMETSARQETSDKARFFESSQGSESSQGASAASPLPSEQRSSSRMMVQPMSSTCRSLNGVYPTGGVYPLDGTNSIDGANEPSPILLLNAAHRLPRDRRVMETVMRMEYPEGSSCEPSEWSFAVSIEIPSRWFVQRWNRYRTQMTSEVATQEAFNQFRRRELSSIAQRLQQVVPAEFTCDLSVTELDNGQPNVFSDVTEPNTSLPWFAILCGTLVLAWVGYRSILSRYFSPMSGFAASAATVPLASDSLASSDSSWTSSAVPRTSRKRPLAGRAAATYHRANASTQETVCEPNHSGMDHSVSGSVIDQAMMDEESETKTSENRLPLPSEFFERVADVKNEDMSENSAEPLEDQAAAPTDFGVLETDELDETVLRREIREAILRNPVHASSVLRSWLGEVDPSDNSITH